MLNQLDAILYAEWQDFCLLDLDDFRNDIGGRSMSTL